MNLICKHCGKFKVSRPRGLCWGCFYTPGVKDMYTFSSKCTHRGVTDSYGGYTLPPAPTDAPPGSEEKKAVLTERAAMGCSLWHPKDRKTN